jgi:hypothetical protein
MITILLIICLVRIRETRVIPIVSYKAGLYLKPFLVG